MISRDRLMNPMKRDSRGRSFSHQHFLNGITSSNLSTDATYFLNITKLGNGVKITFVIDSSINASIQYDAANSKISFIQESSIRDIIFREDFIHIVQHNEYYGDDMIQENKVNIEFEAKIFWDIASTFQYESDKFYVDGSDAYMDCLKDYQDGFGDAYQAFGNAILKDGYFGAEHYDLYRNALSKWKSKHKEYQGTYNEDFLPEMLEDVFKK